MRKTIYDSNRLNNKYTALLNEKDPADALGYLLCFLSSSGQNVSGNLSTLAECATGYMAISRTGIDLFVRLSPLRLPSWSRKRTRRIYAGLPPGTAVIPHAAETYLPVLQAF